MMLSADPIETIFEFCGGRLAAAQFLGEVHYHLLQKWIYAPKDTDALPLPRKVFGDREFSSSIHALAAHRTQEEIERFAKAAFSLLDRSRSDTASPYKWPYFSPLGLPQAVLGKVIDEPEIRYVIARNIRRRWKVSFSATHASDFYFHAQSINRFLSEHRSRNPDATVTVDSSSACVAFLIENAGHKLSLNQGTPSTIGAFIDAALLAGSILPHPQQVGKFRFPAAEIDAEFVLAHLLDMPTRINGFNEILGGVGPRLSDHSHGNSFDASSEFPGRYIIVTGRPGSAKSLLGMSLALEVAKKGGIAWYYPLEQTFEQARYCLNTVASMPRDGSVAVTQTAKEAGEYLKDAKNGAGLIALLRARDEGIDELLNLLNANVQLATPLMSSRIQLLVVDPINAVSFDSRLDSAVSLHEPLRHPLGFSKRRPTLEIREGGTSESVMRSRSAIFDRFVRMTEKGMNVLVVLEERAGLDDDLLYGTNLADTVIRMSVDDQDQASAHGYARRRIEIVKSRYQREQRGRHACTIRPGTGLHVFPGTSSYRLRNLARTIRVGEHYGLTGLPSLDRLLSKMPVRSGLTMVLRGPIGSFRTHLSLAFLRQPSRNNQPDQKARTLEIGEVPRKWNPQPRKVCNLFITMRFSPHQVDNLLSDGLVAASGDTQIETVTVTSGAATTGQIFAEIDEAFHRVKSRGVAVERVVLDEFGDWSDLNPFVHDDAGFAPTLIDFLRRRSLAMLITLTVSNDDNVSALYRTALETADTLVDLDRVNYSGRSRVLVRVVHTPEMQHQPEAYELEINSSGRLQVQDTPSLLRTKGDEVLGIARIRLYLSCETDQHHAYYMRLQRTLRNVLTPTATVQRLDDMVPLRTDHLGRMAVIDEVQVWQRDEFEVEAVGQRGLHLFKLSDVERRLPGFLELPRRFIDRCCDRNQGFCFAIPYYDNLSLLAFREDLIRCPKESTASWEQLAELAIDFEARFDNRNDPGNSLFFDFAKGPDENYNSLFIEILASINPIGDGHSDDRIQLSLVDWLKSDPVLLSMASRIFWQLGTRAHRFRHNKSLLGKRSSRRYSRQAKTDQLRVSADAHVYRHWFTTYVQFVADLAAANRQDVIDDLRTCRLPGRFTTAGEWYLMIPAHSATPAVGLDILESVCSRHAELERFRAGVGLPVRPSLYGEYRNLHSVDPDLFLPNQLRFIRRSCFEYYTYLSPILGGYVRQLLDQHEMSDRGFEEWSAGLVAALEQSTFSISCERTRSRR